MSVPTGDAAALAAVALRLHRYFNVDPTQVRGVGLVCSDLVFPGGADAFRGLAFRHYTPKHNPEAQAAKSLRAAQRDSGESFRWSAPRAGRGGY